MADLNENNDNIEMKEEETVPSERIKKMKQKLERLVKKMKQPDEEELVDSFKSEDKKEENAEYEIKDIFAYLDGNEPDIFDEAEEKEEKQAEFVEKEKAKELFEKLPEYNIFDENANQGEIQKNEEIEEIIKKADTEKSVAVEKKEQPNTEPVAEKKEQPKITEIRFSPNEEKDFSEGDSFHIVYHSEEENPFIVIAGKFGRTLRGEYEATRKYRESRKAEEEKNSNIVQMPKPPVQTKKVKFEF